MAAEPLTAERLLDRAQIQDALHRYCHAIDRQQLDELVHVFHDDAVSENRNFKGDIPGFIAQVRIRHATLPQTVHLVSNSIIEFTGPDTAFVETYYQAMERSERDGQMTDRVSRGRYGDSFERRAGVWKISYRRAVQDHEMRQPTSMAQAPPGPITGSRNADDPIVRLRHSLGLAVES